MAYIDSASHLTSYMYLDMATRDYCDLEWFPEIKNELNGLYEAWINLLNEYEKIDL